MPTMGKEIKRIKRARISFLSLVPRGANRLPGLYKSEDNNLEWAALTKAPEDFQEKGQLLSLVYVPETEDSEGHIASAEAIEKMAHSFMEEGAKLDIRHDRKELKKDQAYVAESFIVQKGDPRFAGMSVDPTGGWGVVVQIEDNSIRKAYKEEGWNSVSLFSYPGDYELVTENPKIEKALEEFQKSTDDLDMDKKELAELLKENNESLVAVLAKALKPEEKEEKKEKKKEADPAEDGKPIFKGSYSDPKALSVFQKELEAYELRKSVDFNKPDEVAEYIKKISATKEEDTDDNEDLDKENSDKVAELEAQIASLKKQKRGSKLTQETDNNQVMSGLSKEDQEAWEAGQEIAKIANGWRGIK